ncbi:MAG: ATP-dependent helicase, partial [Candidatus Anstonellales archaeon]
MISFAKKELSDNEILAILQPPIKAWFLNKYKTFSPPQRFAIKEICDKKNVLISSPTGSGKTLAAFLGIINELYTLKQNNELEDKVYCIYISPLRALNNDIKRNLLDPLKELAEMGYNIGIRIGVRTSDTTQAEKASMLKKPPHILITTPESFAIMLNAQKFSSYMQDVRWVIVDEIHALVDNKRGAHLSLSLERLNEKCNFVRIGLSATVHPLEEVAKYLVGNDRHCIIVDVNYLKLISIDVLSPVDDLIYTDSEVVSSNMYKILDKIIDKNKTTLIFTNTRSATERVVFHLKQKFGDKYIDSIATHHSSLSRKIRLETEEKLKRGQLKAVVCSTSLELGIDIGSIDTVVLIGSPKSVSRALQRIGRSGHKLHEKSTGHIIVLDRDDLLECTVLAHNALKKKFDSIRLPHKPFDVLIQHLLGMALEKKYDVKEAYHIVKRSYVYKDLTFSEFEKTLEFLSGSYEGLEARNVYGKIWYDGKEFGRRGKMARAIYYMNVGTIPEETYVKVFLRNGDYIGNVEEEFAEKLVKGDIFVLGGKTYEFAYSKGNRIYVDQALEKKPTIPAWFSEMLPLSYELALDIAHFRERIAEMDRKEALQYLVSNYNIDKRSAEALFNYIKEQKAYSIVPDKHRFLVEEYEDENFRNYIFHTLAGRKANEAIARAFAFMLGQKKGVNIKVSINDYGFMLSLPRWRRANEEDIKELLFCDEQTFMDALKKGIEWSELIRRRFRQVAVRGLLILKRYGEHEKSISRQQLSADSLLKLLYQYDKEFILIKEAYNECLYEAMHADEALDYLKKISTKILHFEKNLKVPSPFAFNIVAMGGRDVIMMEDRKAFIRR